MRTTKLQNSEPFTKYYFNPVEKKKSNICQATITCFGKKTTITCFGNVDSIDEESYTHRILSYGDVSLIANKKYGYRYDNTNTIFDICGSRKHLERHIRNYLELPEGDRNKTLTSIINIYNVHWVAMVISCRNNQYYAYYIDSLGDEINPVVHKSLNTCNIYNILASTIKQQTDHYNCGLWALENAHHINNIIKDYEPYLDTENFMLPNKNTEYFAQTREKYLKDNEPYLDTENFMLPDRNAEDFAQTRERCLFDGDYI